MKQVLVWQELLLAAVGEQFSAAVDAEDEICGVSVRIRYDNDVIQIWNQNSELGSKARVTNNEYMMITWWLHNDYIIGNSTIDWAYSFNRDKTLLLSM